MSRKVWQPDCLTLPADEVGRIIRQGLRLLFSAPSSVDRPVHTTLPEAAVLA